MDLAIEPELYAPSINDQGVYIDKIPPIRHGIQCPCGARKEKVFDTRSQFNAHIKTKAHQKWLDTLNENRMNLYVENIELRETVLQQRLIIAQQERAINNHMKTIAALTEKFIRQETPIENLIDL
jgi:hypothetical protein